MSKKTIKTRTNDSICVECAKGLGGKWPKDHLATSWTGKCGICGENKGVVDIGDYNWPDKKQRGIRD